MTELPASVKVGPYEYGIESDKPFTDSHNCWAYVRYGKQLITIDPETRPDRLRVAVLHELLHAIHDMTNANTQKWEEAQVTQDAPLIVQLLRDNPALVTFLTAADDARVSDDDRRRDG